VYLILIVDFIVVFTTICFINLLDKRYREYADIFDKRNVEMRDFTIQVTNLPMDFEFGGKDILLTAQLWNHFEKHLKEAMESAPRENENQERLDQLDKDRCWEVTDINFGKFQNKEMVLLTKMDKFDREKAILYH